MLESQDTFAVVLPPGTWFSESPFIHITMDPARQVEVATLWPGIHRFGGRAGLISVEVGRNGSTTWVGILPEAPEGLL